VALRPDHPPASAAAELPVQATAQAPFDTRALRQTLGAFVTGVTIVTTVDGDGTPHGLTVNSFSSVSLDPPLVLWSQSLAAPSHPVFRAAERFAVNVLAENQHALSNTFARGSADKFAHCKVRTGLGDVPLIEGCIACLECRKVDNLPGGDHMVFLGQVERIWRLPAPPLVFGGGRYLVAQPHELDLSEQSRPHVASQRLLRQATRCTLELATELDLGVGVAVWGNLGPTLVHWAGRGDAFRGPLRAGLVLPLHSSATGQAFAAWLPQPLTAPLLQAELSPAALRQDFEQQLATTRQAGVACLQGVQRDGDPVPVTALSIPVFDPHGHMLLALTVAAPSSQLDDSRIQSVTSRLQAIAGELAQEPQRIQPLAS
jgi:flavin reductase (DIM6/NTAB) family NADH-FMN oxidoreductase RutF/DNA-binding IclR family transcriptional regulator